SLGRFYGSDLGVCVVGLVPNPRRSGPAPACHGRGRPRHAARARWRLGFGPRPGSGDSVHARAYGHSMDHSAEDESTRGIIPAYLLARLAQSGRFTKAADAARQTLLAGRPQFRARINLSIDENGDLVAELTDAPNRTISDAQNTEQLPGLVVRAEDDAPVDDPAVNEAFDGLGATFELLLAAFGRNSLDGLGAPLDATVHYGADYDNAFWDGERMVFGDGD